MPQRNGSMAAQKKILPVVLKGHGEDMPCGNCNCCKAIAAQLDMKAPELKNGGMQVVKTGFFVFKEVFGQRGTDAWQKQVAETTARMFAAHSREERKATLDELKEILRPHLHHEEKEAYEERIKESKETEKELRQKLSETAQKLEQTDAERKGLLEKLNIPTFKGRLLERKLYDQLRQILPQDNVHIVKDGQNEIDLVVDVRNSQGTVLGNFVVEVKNAQRWDGHWIETTQAHMKNHKTFYGLIATTVLPKSVTNPPEQVEGVWVVPTEQASAVARVLREQVLREAEIRAQVESEKKQIKEMSAMRKKFENLLHSKDFQRVSELCNEALSQLSAAEHDVEKFAESFVEKRVGEIRESITQILQHNTNLDNSFKEFEAAGGADGNGK